MKKKILMGCALLMMAVSMVACGSKSDSVEEETRRERERDSDESGDSDGESALLGQLASLIGDEVPLAAVAETKIEEKEEDIRDVEVEATTVEETIVEETVVEETTVEAEVTAADSDIFNLSIEDPVFYNENGVTLTFDGFENRTIYDRVLKIKVENNNPDNKKVCVQIHHVAINNMLSYSWESEWQLDNEDDEGFLLAGESGEITVSSIQYHPSISGTDIMFYEWQQERLEIPDDKVHTVGIYFNIQIGTDGEGEERTAILKTKNYEEGYLESYYGDYVTSVEVPTRMESYLWNYEGVSAKDYNINMDGKGIVDIYKKNTESGIVFVLKNTDEELIYDYSIRFLVNGEDITEVNDKADNAYVNLLMGNGGIDIYEVAATAGEIRSAFEIGNDVPLELAMRFDDEYSGEYIVVSVATIE